MAGLYLALASLSPAAQAQSPAGEQVTAVMAVAQTRLMSLALSGSAARPIAERRARNALDRAQSALAAGNDGIALRAANEAAAFAELAAAEAELHAAIARRDRLRAEIAALSTGH